ncbi:MAG: PaaI family thioesterase [Acidobacteriia bacterium]|nr:PaaI family thioesterase [Terriglobia bacterium]
MAFEDTLAIRVVRKHTDGVTVECPLRKDYENSQGVLHGGVIASIADEAAWHAMLHAYHHKQNATTTELKINYLRPIAGSKVVARAYALRAGKTLFVSRVDMFDTHKKLSAVGIVTYMLLPA